MIRSRTSLSRGLRLRVSSLHSLCRSLRLPLRLSISNLCLRRLRLRRTQCPLPLLGLSGLCRRLSTSLRLPLHPLSRNLSRRLHLLRGL